MVDQQDTSSGFTDVRDHWAARWHAFWERRQARAEAARHGGSPPGPGSTILKWAGGALLLLIILILIFFDWNMLRGPISRYASYRLHRQVRIEGNLKVHLWSWTPSANVDGIRIANTKWAGGGDMAKVGHLTVSVKLLPLLGGHLRLPLVDVEHSSFLVVRDVAGHSNWEFNKTASNKPLKLPAINRFLINDGKLQIFDARKRMRFAGTVSSSESTTGRGRGFVLTGNGTLNGARFTADVRGAPLLNVDQSKPYPFTMNILAAYTHVTARGEVTHPFDLGALDAAVNFSGRDAAELYYLTGIVLPNTPPYQVSAHVTRDGEIFRAENLSGRLGHSDLSGFLTVDSSGEKMLLTGSLHSVHVYFDDLGFLFGGGKGREIAARAPASTRQAAASTPSITLAGDKTPATQTTLLLPDTPLDVYRVRQMNADVRYHAASIVSSTFPLRSLSVHVKLNDGVLQLDPVAATLAQGSLAGRVKINATRAVPLTNLDLRVKDIQLQQLVHPASGQTPIEGAVEARAILTAAGNSVHRAAANASGSLTLVIPHGEMRKAFAELLGINLLNGGVALLTGDQTQTGVRCAVADFQARDGVFNARNILLDTDVERGSGRGDIDLRNETVNLTLSGEAKSLRILRMNAPITITGSLSHPKVGVQASKALAQGGLAVALGALVNPIAAVLATVDPGLAKDANCGAVLAEAKQKGAPVSRRAAGQAGSANRALKTTPTAEHVARPMRAPQ